MHARRDGSPVTDWPSWFAALNQASARARAQAREVDAYERLRRARDFIDTHYEQALDLERIAEAACFSRYHFLRSFRRAFGITPHQYMTRKRIERARELLVTTALPVTSVCLEVGFTSLGSFSSLFQRHVGHSPNRYRRVIVQSLGIPGPLPGPAIPACFASFFAAPIRR
ncbi:helix-turn-helix domain-containing protein [Haliangium sp.]|uniref:helix-turn-helix domain-containing protein n=1 Tax=Haliangium sp. TaxID=2663208 RepID=UPI003D13D350